MKPIHTGTHVKIGKVTHWSSTAGARRSSARRAHCTGPYRTAMRANTSLIQLKCVLQPTGALQYEGISRVAVALTVHLNATESTLLPHLYVHSVPAFVLTLDHFWDEGLASRGASNTLELRH
ncbi:hypothetical protein EYF80_009043 [Liparis tanakae]|uniref:Uncharacterized protein n=1 Tax=Liparis tanakae TaxID=230148 RepID=A0A4Z2ITQ9_9TELE|nr:hypothetical protein EYF80_009043 [Liparis tanakae]